MDILRKCIICSKLKSISDFNNEHVFPAAIGGTFTTNKVCIICNALLNKKIDEPFVKSNFVISFRNIFELNRDSNRSIPKAIKGKVKNAEGNDVLLKFENGKLKSEFIDKFDYRVLDDGRVECILTIDINKLDKKEEIIKKRIKRLSKKFNAQFAPIYTIFSIHNNITKSFSVTYEEKNIILIKECIKVAYEFASIASTDYAFDETAQKLSSFLISDIVTDDIKKQLDSVATEKRQEYIKRFNLLRLPIHHHAVLVENVEGFGVYAVIKMFDYLYPILLTRNCKLFPKQEFLFVNDILTGALYSNQILNYKLLNLTVEIGALSYKIQENVKIKGIRYFETKCFYNENGNVKFNDLNALCYNIIDRDNLNRKNINWSNFELNFVGKKIFVKTIDDQLIPIRSISLTQEIVIQNLPR